MSETQEKISEGKEAEKPKEIAERLKESNEFVKKGYKGHFLKGPYPWGTNRKPMFLIQVVRRKPKSFWNW